MGSSEPGRLKVWRRCGRRWQDSVCAVPAAAVCTVHHAAGRWRVLVCGFIWLPDLREHFLIMFHFTAESSGLRRPAMSSGLFNILRKESLRPKRLSGTPNPRWKGRSAWRTKSQDSRDARRGSSPCECRAPRRAEGLNAVPAAALCAARAVQHRSGCKRKNKKWGFAGQLGPVKEGNKLT